MESLHRDFLNRFSWYKTWHGYAWHNSMHWFVFLFFNIAVTLAISSLILEHNQSIPVLSAESNHLESKNVSEKNAPSRAHDRVLIQFKSDIDDGKQKEILHRHNAAEKETIRGTRIKIVSIPSGVDPVEMVEKLKKDDASSLDFVETDDLVIPEFTPNDALYASQWHLPKIEAPTAWDSASAMNVLIGICDTGVDGQHADLSSVLRADMGFNTVDNSLNWSPVHPHGTYVSGAAAAAFHNSLGVAGVARDAAIIPVRISNLSDGGAYYSDAAECISYAADNGARVINLSYLMAGSQTIDAAAAYAEGKNAITVVAAGNNGQDPAWPDFPTFLAVGATDQSDTRASWSNYGAYIDVVAPGVSIFTTSPGNQYTNVSGTSLASPLVVGTLALMTGGSPSSSAAELKNALYSTADDVGISGDDTVYGYGRINARKAVEYLLGSVNPTPTFAPSVTPYISPTPSAVPTITPVPDTTAPTVSITYPTSKTKISPNSTVVITASASDNSGVKQVDIRVSIVTQLSGRQTTITPHYNCIDVTAPYSCSWVVPNNRNVTYLIQAVAQDVSGNSATSKSVQFTVR